MTGPALHYLGPQMQTMARNVKDERLAMTMQWAALGCMGVAAAATVVHLVKDLITDKRYHELRGRLDRHHEDREHTR